MTPKTKAASRVVQGSFVCSFLWKMIPGGAIVTNAGTADGA
jgi:hypothetical protein